VGAGLLRLLGPTHGILLNAAFYLPLIVFLWRAPYGPKFRPAGAPVGRAVQGFRDLWSTARDIAGDRTILSMTVLAGSSAVMIGSGYQAQMPAYATDLGHGDAGVFYSMLLAADAAGALTAAIVLEGRNLLPPQPRTAVVLAMLWCAAIGGFAATTVYPLALALLFCAGFVSLAFNAMAQTLVQLHAPAPIRGRVIGFYTMSGLGLRAFSGLTVGLGGAVVGVHASLGLSAAVLFAVTLTLFVAMRRPAPVESAPVKPAPGD
ncbi:MAG: MFS transporter, partial [Alphaproteobacteria bacterium]|nr:MFS transporter [Alphaproteobacteria bacterium]